jgi:histidinol-phosphate aminotransferase
MSAALQLGPAYVRALAPYVAGRPISEVAREFGLDEASIVKLASNENPLGMPASARRAIEHAMAELGRYPDSNGFDLKAALSARFGVPADWLTLGNGSNDILELAAHAFLEPGQSAVFSQYAFAIYALAVQGVGARGIVASACDYGHDLDAMLAAIRPDTRLMYIANPNNPTGTFVDGERVEALLRRVPGHVVVVLDEAYTEFLDASHRYDSVAWTRRYPNLLVTRTFSKAYGLAGLRVGFAIGQPALTDMLNRLRQPFNVNSLAQAAAVAALGDEAFLAEGAKVNAAGYAQLTHAFDRMRLQYLPSYGNFVLVRVGDDADAGNRVNVELLRQGVIVRPVEGYGLPQWVRVSIGLPQENAAFIAALEKTRAMA